MKKSVWLFPVVLLGIALVLTLFKVSGSSVGYYNQLFGVRHDSNLIYGQPRAVRSDEWLVTTSMTIAQWREGFPRVNPKIGDGLDMSVIFDVPYRGWSALFRPQNLSFLALPLENAFAFKWWLLGGALAVAGYFFVMAILPGRRAVAALLGLGLLFSPFVQWWYQTITIAPLVYSMALVALFAASLRVASHPTKVLYALGMGYLLTCFALVMYPPFQIPCAIVAAAVGLGLWLEHKNEATSWKTMLKQLLPVLVGALLAAVCVAAFLSENSQAIKLLNDSAYPGHRVATGGFGLIHLFDGFVDNRLQFETATQHYHYNQSEASNFIYLWPALGLAALLLAYRRWRAERRIEWPVILVSAVLALFSADLFVRLPEVLLKLTGLAIVPHSRLLIGFGLANLALIALLLRQLKTAEVSRRAVLAITAATFLVYTAEGFLLHHRHEFFVPSVLQFLILAATIAAACFLLLKNRAIAAGALLLILGIYSVYRVDPLYVGLGPLTDSKIVHAVREAPQAQRGEWVDLDDFYWVNSPAAAGVPALSATYSYPQLGLWRQLDPSEKLEDVYNRYGSAVFTERQVPATFVETSPDQYFVAYDPCAGGFAARITHVLSQHPVSSPCLRLNRTVVYPATTFYLYNTARVH